MFGADVGYDQEEKLYGVAIQFQKDPNNVLRVFDIKKGGPAWCERLPSVIHGCGREQGLGGNGGVVWVDCWRTTEAESGVTVR